MIQGIFGFRIKLLKFLRDSGGYFRISGNSLEQFRSRRAGHEFSISDQARHWMPVIVDTDHLAHFNFRQKVFEAGCNIGCRRVDHFDKVNRSGANIKTRFNNANW
jgi:hypothetical protein